MFASLPSRRIPLRFRAFCLTAALVSGWVTASAHTASVIDDSFLSPTPQGDSPTLQVVGTRSVFVRFDYSPLPDGARVEEVTLRLYVNRVTQAGDVSVFLVDGPWNEATLTDAIAPPLGAQIATAAIAATAERDYLNIRLPVSAVQDVLDGVKLNFGVALVSGLAPPRVLFDSKENTATSHAPEMEIATVSETCPPGTHRAGAWCIGPQQSAANHVNAMTNCWSKNMQLCPIQAIMACDNVQPAGADCTTATDLTVWIWAAEHHTDVDDVAAFGTAGRARAFNDGGADAPNELDWVNRSTVNIYFCCTER